MTITLEIGSGKPFLNCTTALATIGPVWDDNVLLLVYSDIIDSVNFGHLTTSNHTLTIQGVGLIKPVWTSNASHNFTTTNPCHVFFKNLELKQNTANRCIETPNARDVTIDQCVLNGSASVLVNINAGAGESCNATLTNNIFTKGVYLGGTYKSFWKIINNTWYAVNPTELLRIAHTSTNPTLIVQNNIFAMDSTLTTAKFVELNYTPFGTWTNNVYYNAQAPLLWTIATTDYSTFGTWETAVGELNSDNLDPLFTSAPTDLTVQTGSPVIDAGLNLTPYDHNNIKRY